MGRKMLSYQRVSGLIEDIAMTWGCYVQDKSIMYEQGQLLLDIVEINYHVEHQQFGPLTSYIEEVVQKTKIAYYDSVYMEFVKLFEEKEWDRSMVARRPGCPKWEIK